MCWHSAHTSVIRYLHADLYGVLSQDAVRGDHGEVAQLLMSHGAKIFKTKENRLVDLNRSHLAG